ncbi:MAG TPA: tRNA lysidine(34) synthetase TilS [Candidatus Edwardsbacteria bacterium]|nr:tRNA lysidine(34) synthetase TilS [Candidatus Edwardsbacteria bacterium]
MTRDALAAGVLRGIAERGLLRPGDRVLVALSGGPDSVALLLLLRSLRDDLGIALRAAHLDHGLRGRESAGDAAFCRELARSLAVPLACGKANVRQYATSRRLSLETAARDLRRKFLLTTATKHRCTAIATAHTRDDQAETVLLHLLRGSGLAGLAGIPRRNGPFVRPLLDVDKREVLRYLRRHDAPFREDSSNRSLDHTRNRVRHRLIPELRRYNPQIVRSLARLADNVSADLEVIAGSTAAALGRCASVSKSQITIDLSGFKLYNIGLQRNLIRQAARTLAGAGAAPDSGHTGRALRLMASAGTGKRMELLPGIWIATAYGQAIISKRRTASGNPAPAARAAAIAVPGTLNRPSFRIDARLLRRRGRALRGLDRPDAAFFDWDALQGQALTAGPREPGERMVPFGGARPKKLKELMIEARLPRAARAGWPVIRAGRDALWVPRVRRSAAAAVTATTTTILCLEFIPHEA